MNNNLRIGKQRKLAAKPKYLNLNMKVKRTLRSRAYLYNTLPAKITTSNTSAIFKKNLKLYMSTLPWNCKFIYVSQQTFYNYSYIQHIDRQEWY